MNFSDIIFQCKDAFNQISMHEDHQKWFDSVIENCERLTEKFPNEELEETEYFVTLKNPESDFEHLNNFDNAFKLLFVNIMRKCSMGKSDMEMVCWFSRALYDKFFELRRSEEHEDFQKSLSWDDNNFNEILDLSFLYEIDSLETEINIIFREDVHHDFF